MAVRSDDAQVNVFADQLYEELLKKGVEVIYDDRTVRAGVMFSDADLLGVPLRVVVSPRNLKQNQLEVVSRDKTFSENIPAESAAERLMEILKERL